QGCDLIEEVAWMARTERTVAGDVVSAMQIRRHHRMELDVATTAVQLEDLGELLDRRVADRDLVRNTAKERFIGERQRVEVGRKYRQHIERHLKLLAGMQRQVVDATLERHDPSVEQILGSHPLPSEVVDEEDASVGLEL